MAAGLQVVYVRENADRLVKGAVPNAGKCSAGVLGTEDSAMLEEECEAAT
jgi:hypothetical protein